MRSDMAAWGEDFGNQINQSLDTATVTNRDSRNKGAQHWPNQHSYSYIVFERRGEMLAVGVKREDVPVGLLHNSVCPWLYICAFSHFWLTIRLG